MSRWKYVATLLATSSEENGVGRGPRIGRMRKLNLVNILISIVVHPYKYKNPNQLRITLPQPKDYLPIPTRQTTVPHPLH